MKRLHFRILFLLSFYSSLSLSNSDTTRYNLGINLNTIYEIHLFHKFSNGRSYKHNYSLEFLVRNSFTIHNKYSVGLNLGYTRRNLTFADKVVSPILETEREVRRDNLYQNFLTGSLILGLNSKNNLLEVGLISEYLVQEEREIFLNGEKVGEYPRHAGFNLATPKFNLFTVINYWFKPGSNTLLGPTLRIKLSEDIDLATIYNENFLNVNVGFSLAYNLL